MRFTGKDDFNRNEIAELENHYDFWESLNDSLKDLLLQGMRSKTKQELSTELG